MPGIVTVEISIENDILSKLNYAKKNWQPGESTAVHNFLRNIIYHELLRLRKLEAREPGAAKYRELLFIDKGIKQIFGLPHLGIGVDKDPGWPQVMKIIDMLIAEFTVLKKMELRLG